MAKKWSEVMKVEKWQPSGEIKVDKSGIESLDSDKVELGGGCSVWWKW